MPFSTVLRKYGTDARFLGTDKVTTHSYGDLYDLLAERLRHRPRVDVLEIGVQHGAFMHALVDYLPQARVHGLAMAWVDLRAAKGRFDDVVALFSR